MSVEGIHISLDQVSKTAGTVRTINTSLDSRLQDIKKQMNDLAQTWQSDASNTVRERFNALLPKFENYKSIIESYAKFLDSTVTNYNAVETHINSNASSFK